MYLATETEYSVAIGREAAYSAMTGDYNIAIGYKAMYDTTTGQINTCVGGYAGQDITTGNDNVCLGFNAGGTLTEGDYNLCLGRYAGHNQLTTDDKELWMANDNVGAGNIKCWIHGSNTGQCYQGDNSSTWSTTSDRRLKKNIVDNSKGLAEINQIRVTNFEYRTEEEIDMGEFPLADGPHQVVLGQGQEGIVQTGVIAQEIEEVLPECIKVSKRGTKTVNNDPITWALVNAVKELSVKNDELAAEVASLKSQINN